MEKYIRKSMEKYIYYDLIDDETILWSCQGENKASNEKSQISSFIETGMKHSMSLTFAFIAFFVFRIGMHPRYWSALLAMAIISFVISKKIFSYRKEKHQMIYYLTDKRMIILKKYKYSTKQIVRAQHIVDIEKIEIFRAQKERFNVFFSPAKGIDVYEAEYTDEHGIDKRQIDVFAPIAFLSVQGVDYLVRLLKEHEGIDIYSYSSKV